ncbi:sodium/potassium/calcium exchanger Nckx30C isoform X3 [Eupeodes corollae]|uniref:sodium/potassium/calcium exchanger Nckx30C isoform X3 n=1 Tax=Eupeodes corollae TaxID=290404 RepID=UPI0024902146|nr:sodium/potassium/calcium exchanger Nckx30C isoform X3 [Eupeodes corollae]
MGPMLPEQLNNNTIIIKNTTKRNIDNHHQQQQQEKITKNAICKWKNFKNEEKIKINYQNTNKIIKNTNNYYLTKKCNYGNDVENNTDVDLISKKMLPSSKEEGNEVVDTTEQQSFLKIIKNIKSTTQKETETETSTTTTTESQQQQEQQTEKEGENTLDFEKELLFLKTTEEDVQNNYTRRRRRGRLRLQQNNPSDNSPTSTTNETETETEIDTTSKINNNIILNNNNNTAFTIINLDNNFSKTSLRSIQQQQQKINHQQNQQQQKEKLLFIKLNNMLKKFSTLSLMLLLLVITSLSKFYRYVNINIINQNNNNNKNIKRRLAANIINNNNNKYKNNLKFKLNNNKIYVKNYYILIGLFVATTILPLNLVNAAKPFQNSQKHTNHNNNNNNNNHHHGGGGGNGEGHLSSSSAISSSSGATVLTPAPPLLADGGAGGGGGGGTSAASSETEFIYQSSQSDENFDDDDEDKNSMQYNTNEMNSLNNNATGPNITVTKTPLFPPDLFTKEQLENGAVICHIIGVIYMFVALAIVCDEFFVPSLDVIIEKLGITDDVAGATFMAAGGSAPELFTSVIGVFVSFDDVGIGTIVGSAVFNILFVIGMCALFSKTILTLTWWPLFRDCSFYSLSLLILIYFFRDNLIYWWEALILFSIYMSYVGFMKWNQQVERCVKKVITKNKVTRVRSTDQLMPAGNAANSSETSMATQPGGSVTSRAASETRSGPAGSSSGATGNSSSGTTQTGAKFRHGLLQLMIHTIDPLHDDDVPGKVDEKATQLHAIASLKVLLDATKPQRGGATTSAANHVKINLKETTLADRPNGNIDTTLESFYGTLSIDFPINVDLKQGNEIEEPPEALSMAWPSTARKRLTYVLVAPLLFPLWLTLPDTRTPRGKQYYPVTFIGSILWIAAYSYLMVWWANVAGDTARIPPEVMGLTFLAAGTSIPDLITSVIVARKGFGDMAVSSSVGSNIFDVTVGLPIPWLLYGIIYDAPVEVNSVGMVCSITILFMMLLFVVMSIACFRWKMNKGLGFTMFLLYFVFVAVSLMFEYNIIVCPV